MGRKAGARGCGRGRSVLRADQWEEARLGMVAEMVELGVPEPEAETEAVKKVERARLRLDWARERLDAFFALQAQADEAYERQMDAYPDVDWEDEDAPELPDPPEDAAAQAVYAEVMAALKEDRWPRHLHFRGV